MDKYEAALEMASRGCVSGELREWPYLAEAFRRNKMACDLSMRVWDMKRIAIKIIENNAKD